MDKFTEFKPPLSAVQHKALSAAGMLVFIDENPDRCNWCGKEYDGKFTVSHLGDILLVCRDCLLSVGWHVVYMTPNYCREFVPNYIEGFADTESF